MPFTVTYDPETDSVRTRISGSLDKALIAEFFGEVVRVATEHRCTRILSDLRQARVAASAPDIYSEVDSAEHQSVPRDLRRAIVISRDMRDYRFWETVCRHRGHPGVKLFTDYDEAARWVLESGAGPVHEGETEET